MKWWKAYYLKQLRFDDLMKSNGTKARIKLTKKPVRRPYRITFGRAERTDVFKNPAPPLAPVKPVKPVKGSSDRRRGIRPADGANGEKAPEIQPISTQAGVDLTE